MVGTRRHAARGPARRVPNVEPVFVEALGERLAAAGLTSRR